MNNVFFNFHSHKQTLRLHWQLGWLWSNAHRQLAAAKYFSGYIRLNNWLSKLKQQTGCSNASPLIHPPIWNLKMNPCYCDSWKKLGVALFYLVPRFPRHCRLWILRCHLCISINKWVIVHHHSMTINKILTLWRPLSAHLIIKWLNFSYEFSSLQ